MLRASAALQCSSAAATVLSWPSLLAAVIQPATAILGELLLFVWFSHLEQVASEVGLCKSQRAAACACRTQLHQVLSEQACQEGQQHCVLHAAAGSDSPIFTVFVAVALAITLQVLGRARTAGRVALHRAATEWSSEVGHHDLAAPLAFQ
jgi:hypothetical protein